MAPLSELVDGYEPHGTIYSAVVPGSRMTMPVVRGGCTRGSGDVGGLEGCYTGTHPDPSQDPYLTISKARGLPTAK